MALTPRKPLPTHLQEFISAQVKQGTFHDEQEVIATALEAQLAATRRLEGQLEEGLVSPAVDFTEELLAQISERALNTRSTAQPTAS